MSTLLRWTTPLIVGLVAAPCLTAQIRAPVKSPTLTTRTLTPIATTSLEAVGGSGLLGNVVIRTWAEQVKVMSGSVIGTTGFLEMSSPVPGAGIPGSRLLIRSEAPVPTGIYAVTIGFNRARGGDVIQVSDGNNGQVIGSCTLTQQPNYNDVQPCVVSLTVLSGSLFVSASPTVGVQLHPTSITVSRMR